MSDVPATLSRLRHQVGDVSQVLRIVTDDPSRLTPHLLPIVRDELEALAHQLVMVVDAIDDVMQKGGDSRCC